PDGGTTLDMKVDVVERLGSDQYLYGSVGGDQLTARVDPRMAVAPGDRVRLGLDTRGVHFFDGESGQALLSFESPLGSSPFGPRALPRHRGFRLRAPPRVLAQG